MRSSRRSTTLIFSRAAAGGVSRCALDNATFSSYSSYATFLSHTNYSIAGWLCPHEAAVGASALHAIPTCSQELPMILVTGATGLSGSAVIREFARQGYPVRALVRSRAKAQALELFPTVEIVEGDMLRPDTLAAALSGIDRVLL